MLYESPNRVADAQRVVVTAVDLSDDTRPGVWTGPATSYSDYAVPYWVVYPDLPHAGLWGLVAEITRADGTTTQAQAVIEVAEVPQTPGVGRCQPASQNRTLATEADIKKLTSSQEPNPALYQMTVAEALASGRPSVVVFATPAFCQTAVLHEIPEVSDLRRSTDAPSASSGQARRRSLCHPCHIDAGRLLPPHQDKTTSTLIQSPYQLSQ